jgi:hypothetical protein
MNPGHRSGWFRAGHQTFILVMVCRTAGGAYVQGMSRWVRTVVTATLAAGCLAVPSPAGAAVAVPRYDHVFVIVEENHGFADVIGNPAAPNLNALAKRYGLATDYYGVAHPSEPNYVGLLGGNTFGVADDNPYYLNRVDKPSLISQLDHAGIAWKAYLQGLPHAGYKGICYPANCNGSPDKDPLYVSKHNAIGNFTTSWNDRDWSRQVPIEDLSTDLRRGTVPAFGYVIPDECHDQHGDPPFCVDSGSPGDPQDQHLVATGDRYLGQLVGTITGASFWAKGNNAIAVVYDEGDDDAGCCAASPGGGKVAAVVVTSHGPRGVTDPTPYNHYSLLRTIQRSFGLGCLEHTCDTARVTPLDPLFTVTGSPAEATTVRPVPAIATPTPTPDEPVTPVHNTPTHAGWRVLPAPKVGTADNSYGAVAATSPTDVWAVGNFVADAAGGNPDATLTLAAHFDGTRWTRTSTPNRGPNFNTLFGVAGTAGHAWAVGVALDREYRARSLIEAWDGSGWHIASTPELGTQRDMLFSASALSATDVWAVGIRQDQRGRFGTLVEHWDGRRWSVVPSPDPGTSGNQLFAVSAAGREDVWAVGQRNDDSSDRPLVEHWDGRAWHVVPGPAGTGGALLDGVSALGGEVWAVGQTDNATRQGRPLVAHLHEGEWTAAAPMGVGSAFTNLTGVAVAADGVWAVGTFFDPAAERQRVLVAHHDGTGWHPVDAPDPGTGDTVLGGVAASGGDVWAVGYDKADSGRDPLIESHQ